jgi:NAD(P)-dependent dehydrogenase (short-subunit alcohol dehydrogenase family)
VNGVANKVVVVTGGANGIGRVYCERLVAERARLLVADVDGEAAQALAADLNGRDRDRRVVGMRADVTSPTDAAAMAAQAVEAFGQIDVLLNNVGTYPHVAFDDLTYAEWRRVVTVNLDSVFLCTKAVLPQMRHQRAGKIINVATNLVWSGLPEMVHYIAAKSGVVGFTRSLAREVGEDGITVNAVAPGAVVPEGRLADEARERIATVIRYQCVKRGQQPEDLVGMVVFLVSDESNFISGQVFTVDGGLTTH